MRRGFSLINLLITVAIMAIVAAAVTPSIASGNQIGLTSAASLLASDLEYAQSLSLADPENPAMVRFEASEGRYWVSRASNPDTPIPRPVTGEAYVVVLGQGEARHAAGVTMTLSGVVDDRLAFDTMGRLATGSDAAITMSSPSGTRVVRVGASTGFVRID